jgi:hypothetical protein
MAGNCRDITQHSTCVRDYGIAIDAARFLSSPSLSEDLHLALQPEACTLGTLGPLTAHDKTLKTVIALLAHVFENRHGSFTSMKL